MYPSVFSVWRSSRAALVLALLAALLQTGLGVQSARHELWRATAGPAAATQICTAGGFLAQQLPPDPADPASGESRAQTWCAVCAAALAVPVPPAHAAPVGEARILVQRVQHEPLLRAPGSSWRAVPPARAPPVIS